VFTMAPKISASPEDGFSIVEALVALVLTLLIVATALWLLATDTALAESVPHAVDLQQRARLALSLVARDLAAAGSGPAYGRLAGPLARALPAVVPRRIGLTGSDSFTTVRSDALTVLWSPLPGLATETTMAITGSAPVTAVKNLQNCEGVPVCGLADGMTVLAYDDSGRHGLYAVTAVSGTDATLRSLQPSPPSFARGVVLLPVESRTYVFDRPARQLRAYDGYLSDAVVIDDVVGMEVAYVGEGTPPTAPKPELGTANCLFDAVGNPIASLATLPPAGDSLAPLPLEMFADGPWCGEGDRRFDVDLMRVRAVRIRLRMQAAVDQLRGTGIDFIRPGTRLRPLGTVADFTLTTEVTPWNLNVGR